MKRIMALMLGTIAMAGWTGSAFAASDAAKGKTIFAAQCAACHSVQKGQNGIGPSLYGVYGQPAAATPGYQFSPALKSAHITWTKSALDKFLTNPQGDVPGTKMPYMGMANAGDRQDVIAYLASLGAGGK
jgi:cytochrome c